MVSMEEMEPSHTGLSDRGQLEDKRRAEVPFPGHLFSASLELHRLYLPWARDNPGLLVVHSLAVSSFFSARNGAQGLAHARNE